MGDVSIACVCMSGVRKSSHRRLPSTLPHHHLRACASLLPLLARDMLTFLYTSTFDMWPLPGLQAHPPPIPPFSHHIKPQQWTSRVAYGLAQTLRFSFDLLAGFKHRKATEDMFLNRVVFLETVAGT